MFLCGGRGRGVAGRYNMIVFFIVVAVLAVIVIAILAAYRRSPVARGHRGEKLVRKVLGATRPGLVYVFNYYLLANEEMSCQIDHIVVNENGVFVIETKNYSGRLYGTARTLSKIGRRCWQAERSNIRSIIP